MTGTVICMGNFELPDRNAASHRVVNNGKLFRALGLRTVFLGVCRGERYFDGIVQRDYGTGFDMFEQSYPFTARQWAEEIFDMRRLRELVRRYPDTVAILLYNTQYATLLAAKREFSGRGIRVLYDCTEWNGFTEGSPLKKAVKALDSRLIERFLPSACDGLIVVSERMRRRYEKKEPLLLPPLVDTQDAIWRQAPLPKERFTFCYAGDPSNKDRLDLLLTAFSRLPAGAAALRVVGVSREEYAGGEAGAETPVPEHVRFTGRLSHAETVREMQSADCFIFLREPSRRNSAGFPTKFAEAYTCGVPVITTAVSDVARYADGTCLVLPDVSPEGVAAAMTELLSRRPGSRGTRAAFDYRNYADACRQWWERIPWKEG